MKETKEIVKLYNQFEIKYGLNLVDDLKLLMSRIYQKMSDLEKSRDMWKERCMELRKGKIVTI